MDFLNPERSYGEMLDKRDNQVYRTIVISNHVWTAQNMNFKTENDSASKSFCYENKPQNCEKYGRLYTWDAAIKVCPEGWHLPTNDEWIELLEEHSCGVETLEDGTLEFRCAGLNLKSTKTWNEDVEIKNADGFSVVAAGIYYNDTPIAIGELTFIWSVSNYLSLYAYATMFEKDVDSVLLGATQKDSGFSVRCIKGYTE